MSACSGAPLVKVETTKFNDWPLELGPHLTRPKYEGYGILFARIVVVLPLASKT